MLSYELKLTKIIPDDMLLDFTNNKIINYMPLAYTRGVTIDNAIVLIDEMQNVTLDNARTALTRIGENCKIICIGDENQIDLKNQSESSLSILMSILNGIDGIGIVKMNEKDVNSRNPIIPKIEDRFKKYLIEKEQDKAKERNYGRSKGSK
jgi:phosphate starvation-inducible protein PhoH